MGDHDHHCPFTLMKEELQLVEGSPSQTASSTIYRVPKTIREFDMNAYNPQVISIGPYHRNNPSLQAMEAYKWKSLHAMLHRNPSSSFEDYIREIQSLEDQARSHYLEESDMGSDDFVKMMVLDGCFIVEFLLNATGIEKTNEMRPICDTKWIMRVICQDMLLLENQLPFFVIQRLLDLHSSKSSSLVDLAFNFFGLFIPLNSNVPKSESVHHLLHLVRACLLPTQSSIPVEVAGTDHPRLHSVRIPSATEIQGDRIRFKKKNNPDSLMDVTLDYLDSLKDVDVNLDDGVIEIPRLFIQDFITSTLFRNAIAFELCHLESGTYFASYAFLMNCLLKSPKDVELLVEKGIIEHRLGSHEAVVVLFNSLSKGVVLDTEDFHFSRLFVDMASHRPPAWKRRIWWFAFYRFDQPKDKLKIELTILAIYLAVVQTVIAVVTYIHAPK